MTETLHNMELSKLKRNIYAQWSETVNIIYFDTWSSNCVFKDSAKLSTVQVGIVFISRFVMMVLQLTKTIFHHQLSNKEKHLQLFRTGVQGKRAFDKHNYADIEFLEIQVISKFILTSF